MNVVLLTVGPLGCLGLIGAVRVAAGAALNRDRSFRTDLGDLVPVGARLAPLPEENR